MNALNGKYLNQDHLSLDQSRRVLLLQIAVALRADTLVRITNLILCNVEYSILYNTMFYYYIQPFVQSTPALTIVAMLDNMNSKMSSPDTAPVCACIYSCSHN